MWFVLPHQGFLDFKGSRKGAPFVAQTVAEDAAKKAKTHGMKSVEVYVKGPGAGREMAVRAIAQVGFKSVSFKRCHSFASQWLSSSKKTKSLI